MISIRIIMSSLKSMIMTTMRIIIISLKRYDYEGQHHLDFVESSERGRWKTLKQVVVEDPVSMKLLTDKNNNNSNNINNSNSNNNNSKSNSKSNSNCNRNSNIGGGEGRTNKKRTKGNKNKRN